MSGYYRRGRRTRRRNYGRNRRGKPSSRVRRSLKKQPSALQALALKNSRAIMKLQKVTTMRSLWQLPHSDDNVTEPYKYTQLIFPSAWLPVFNSDLRTNASDQYQVQKNLAWRGSHIKIHALIQIESQTLYVPISCCYVVFRPKKFCAQQFNTNTANGSKLQDGVHFTQVTTGLINGKANWMFNRDILDILYIKHFMISEYMGEGTTGIAAHEGAAPFVGNIKDANRNIYCTIPYKKLLRTDNSYNDATQAQDREKSWTDLNDDDIAAEDKIYCALFNNAPGIQVAPPEDQKLYWTQNVMFHGTTASTTRAEG